jgi:amidohydrolase
MRTAWIALLALGGMAPPPSPSLSSSLSTEIDRLATQVDPKVVAWRRDIHQHPELGNREFRTSKLVAAHLQALGLEVRTGIAHTGVIGILRGGKPGPVVALRADMDALPVTEPAGLPFASTERTTYNGLDVGVMHACGHDNHTAILMGVAEVLSGLKAQLPGTVVFLFQPAEEGAPDGEQGGAKLMLAEGAFDNPAPSAVFGLHVVPGPIGRITYSPAAFMASSDKFSIVVHGRATHGALPWAGVDPIELSAQIITGLQTVVSRQVNLTTGAAVVTVGSIHGGVRNNVISDSVVMLGTIRSFDTTTRRILHERIPREAQYIAQSGGGTADVQIIDQYPVTVNNPALVARMLPTLQRVAGEANVVEIPPVTGSEDFSYYEQRVPGFYFFLGVTPPDQDWRTAATNHSPKFFADERALPTGVRALAHIAVDYLTGANPAGSARLPRDAAGQ